MLSEQELARYKRQIIIDEIGENGQEKLKNSKVMVIGTGGLGSPVLFYLAAAGIGTLGIVDSDVVEISNLNRQILHFEKDTGIEKVKSASSKLLRFNPGITVNEHKVRITEANIDDLVKKYDLVVDCVDNLETRYVVNDGCHRQQVPLVEAGIMGFDGFIMTIIPGKGPCYRCLYPEGSIRYGNDSPIGVLGATAGVTGSMQAVEAVKLLLDIGTPLVSNFLTFSLLDMEFNRINLKSNPNCRLCGIEQKA